MLAQSADASAETEVEGLCPDAPALRPADIYTISAQTGWKSAIDIGVTSPHAQYAGEDCCEAMKRRKLDFYGAHLQALHDSGIQYIPAVYSTCGREHPATTRVLETLARRAARKHGLRDYSALLRAARANIGVALVRRHASMILATLAQRRGDAKALMQCRGGDGEDADEGEARAPAIVSPADL